MDTPTHHAPPPDPRSEPVTTPVPAGDRSPPGALAPYDPDGYDWVPVARRPRADGWTPQRQRAFIGELADCGSVATAAQRVGISTSAAYRLRRSPEGQAFAAAWDAAMQQAAHALVDHAFERAINGSEEPVFDKEGQRVGRRMRRSDAMLMFLLRKHFPARYGDAGRDRPRTQAAADGAAGGAGAPPPVATTIAALGPARPADPAALLAPDALADALALADAADGRLPHWQRQDGRDDAPADIDRGLDADFEDALALAKQAACPPDMEWPDGNVESDGDELDWPPCR